MRTLFYIEADFRNMLRDLFPTK